MALGAGGMYLALRWPWVHAVTRTSDGPPVVMVGSDAGVPRPKKKQRPRPAGGSPRSSQPAAGDRDGDGEREAETESAPPPLTAGDRALEWRGDEVALPPRTIDLAGGGPARPLDDGEINQTITGQAGGIKDCVVQGATGADLTATITVKLLVDGHGRVTKLRIQAPHYLFEHGLHGCTQRAAGRLHFPATGEATIVTLPVHLG